MGYLALIKNSNVGFFEKENRNRFSLLIFFVESLLFIFCVRLFSFPSFAVPPDLSIFSYLAVVFLLQIFSAVPPQVVFSCQERDRYLLQFVELM